VLTLTAKMRRKMNMRISLIIINIVISVLDASHNKAVLTSVPDSYICTNIHE
jgi:hypothetical protein